MCAHSKDKKSTSDISSQMSGPETPSEIVLRLLLAVHSHQGVHWEVSRVVSWSLWSAYQGRGELWLHGLDLLHPPSPETQSPGTGSAPGRSCLPFVFTVHCSLFSDFVFSTHSSLLSAVPPDVGVEGGGGVVLYHQREGLPRPTAKQIHYAV